MPSLRIQQDILRFRLNINELNLLQQNLQISIHQPFGAFEIIVGSERKLQYEGNVLQLIIPSADCQELLNMGPNKDGLIFTQDDTQIHFELDIKRPKK
ncbi:MAG: hypothetical protein ACK5LE_02870 [Alphaproteobacteria bacterium]